MKIAFFGSSLVSAYWNGAATYYRGLIRALHAKGHNIVFYEPDAWGRQIHRDIDDPAWAQVVVYDPVESAALRAVEQARGADLIVKASGVGLFDELLDEAIPAARSSANLVAYWDVDAPATLERVNSSAGADPFLKVIPKFDIVFTYGGGDPVIEGYCALGAKRCIPVYNALDPETHFPVEPDDRFIATLGFLGNRLPDREARVEEFFLRAAAELASQDFILGGSGWRDKAVSPNVRCLDHVYTRDHNAFNCSTLAVLNISRDSMARNGYSPATRVFEAAGAGACLITDAWQGIEKFLEPDLEVLVACNGFEVAEQLRGLTPERAKKVGAAGRARVLAAHTYAHRAEVVEAALDGQAVYEAGAV